MFDEHTVCSLSRELEAAQRKTATALQTHRLPGVSTIHTYNLYAPRNILLWKIKSTFGAVDLDLSL